MSKTSILPGGGPRLHLLLEKVRPEWIKPIKEQVFARYPDLKKHEHPDMVSLSAEMETAIRGIIQEYGTT